MTAPYRPGEDVAVVEHAEVVHVARVPAGPVHVLVGSAADIWRAATRASPQRAGSDEDPADRVVAALCSGLGVQPAEVAEDVRGFLADLVARGLLQPI